MSHSKQTIGELCGIASHSSWMRSVLRRPNLCARCHSILADVNCLHRTVSEEGFDFQVPLRRLYESAELELCRMCSIFLCLALHSPLEKSFFEWSVAKFLEDHDAATTVIKVRGVLQPESLRKSACDIHELLVYGKIVDSKLPARDLMSSHLRFKIYGSPGNQSATYMTSMECDDDVHSTDAYSKIRSWIADCDNQHSSCPRRVPMPLPTRVLDLQLRDNVRVRKSFAECGHYATLSYCWGGRQQVETTLSSFDGAGSHIAVSSLPLTIQDAIAVTRQIGLQYLWVDALCIIQDSDEDKDTEIGRMAQYYQNSFITIIAASASGSEKGFLAPRESPRSLEPESVPYKFNLPMVFPDGIIGTTGIEYCVWDNGVSPEPLDRRAWAYQEHILCRRALIYGTSTVTWRCEHGMQTWHSWLRRHQKAMINLLPKSGDPFLYKKPWMNMVGLYGRRNLTFPEDKLPAISALASQIRHLAIQGGGEPGKYLAGIWENDLLDQLTWFSDPETSRDVRCIPYRAPSWSWASVECPIIFPDPRNGLALREIESNNGTELEIVECSVTPRSERLPLGQVIGGHLRARGFLIHGASVPEPETWLLGSFRGTECDVVLKLDCYGIGDQTAISKAQSCYWLRVQYRHGLVLDHIQGTIYRRVGCVVLRNWPDLRVERRLVDII